MHEQLKQRTARLDDYVAIYLLTKDALAPSQGGAFSLVIAGRGSVYLRGIVVRVASEAAWLCIRMNLSESDSGMGWRG